MTDWRTALLLALPLLLGARDPFQPPEDKCHSGQLSRWHYRGAVGKKERFTGFIQDSGRKWRRVTQGQQLETGWKVLSVKPERMEIIVGEQCEPSRWYWLKEGGKDGSVDRSGSVIAGGNDNGNGKRKRATSDAYGG